MSSHRQGPSPVACAQVIRNYHGHLSGIYSIALHPTLDVLMTGGRDAVCRVWDMRTKVQVHCLSGHDDTVCSILSQGVDPQARPALSPRNPPPHVWWPATPMLAPNRRTIYPVLLMVFAGFPVQRLRDLHVGACICGVEALATVLPGRHTCMRKQGLLGGPSCSFIKTLTDLVAVRQVITGSHDKMIKMWDLRKGKTMGTLTYHKKSVRAMAMHPKQFAFAAASADNIKKYQLPQARTNVMFEPCAPRRLSSLWLRA